jgi:hypothetical protein
MLFDIDIWCIDGIELIIDKIIYRCIIIRLEIIYKTY